MTESQSIFPTSPWEKYYTMLCCAILKCCAHDYLTDIAPLEVEILDAFLHQVEEVEAAMHKQEELHYIIIILIRSQGDFPTLP